MLHRVWIGSPNYSSRGGAGVRLVVIHTAEGALTYQSLGNYFTSPSAGVSSHTGIDDTPNTIGEYVVPPNKAWTAANYNPIAIQTELCAFAAWTPNDWANHPTMLQNCAAWIREECDRYDIPIVKLSAAEAQSSGRGVCGHVDLGTGGGGHWDPGPSFPWNDVIELAKHGAQPPPAVTEQKDPNMIAVGQMKDGRFEVFVESKDGEVWHAWNARDGGWAGQEKGSTAAHWESLGTPGKN
jgi:hypothetical protein